VRKRKKVIMYEIEIISDEIYKYSRRVKLTRDIHLVCDFLGEKINHLNDLMKELEEYVDSTEEVL
jgi:hypothetical protein